MAIIILRCMAQVISGWSFDAIAAVDGAVAGAGTAATAAEGDDGDDGTDDADDAADCSCLCCELAIGAGLGSPVVATGEPATVALTREPESGAAQPASNVANNVERNVDNHVPRNNHCGAIPRKANLAMMFRT